MSECSGTSSSPLAGLFLLLSFSKPGCCSSATLDLCRPVPSMCWGIFFKGRRVHKIPRGDQFPQYIMLLHLALQSSVGGARPVSGNPTGEASRPIKHGCRRRGRARRAEACGQLLGARTESWSSQEAKALLGSLRARVPASFSVCPGVLELLGFEKRSWEQR